MRYSNTFKFWCAEVKAYWDPAMPIHSCLSRAAYALQQQNGRLVSSTLWLFTEKVCWLGCEPPVLLFSTLVHVQQHVLLLSLVHLLYLLFPIFELR